VTLERHESTAATQDALGQVGIADSLELAGDRYKFIGIIGRGGMGVVLRVLDTSFQRMLAIKVLRTDHGHSPVKRASRECCNTREFRRFTRSAGWPTAGPFSA
jgi:hypothetical protein